MQTATITLVYHGGKGHTWQLAHHIAQHLCTPQTAVRLLDAGEAKQNFAALHEADCIVSGCPTYFGNAAAAFKEFRDATGSFWYKQCGKNKLAAGFTLFSTTNGDKLHTHHSLMLFAAQHGVRWISLGVRPRFLNDEQTDGQNRLAGYVGLMAQCNDGGVVRPLHPGDALTAELFARRPVETTLQFKNIKINNHVTLAD